MILGRNEDEKYVEGHRSSTLPLVIELRPAPDPVEAFRKLASLPYVLFLDSASANRRHGRYSYITAQPFEVLLGRGNHLEVHVPITNSVDEVRYRVGRKLRGDPWDNLARRLGRWREGKRADLPPFQAGAAGLFGYGLSRTIERLPVPRHDEFEAPDLAVGMYDWVLSFDHELGSCYLVSQGFPALSADQRIVRARQRARQIRALLESSENQGERSTGTAAERTRTRSESRPLTRNDLAPHWRLPIKEELYSNFRKADYIAQVHQAIEYVHAGDIFQVNLSQRLIHPQTSSPLDFYLELRRCNPASFAGYFDMGRHVIASSSPEQFLSVRDGLVTTRPIKGTRSRGYTPEEDTYRKVVLQQSEKDRAENVMIVDLLRNDLSKVCRPGTVTVPRLFEQEQHPTVHHLVSEVRGQLREHRTALDLLRASFPGGSITGAPKVRAMEIIAELEPTARGAYCGTLGWISFHGDMGTSILIRTVTISRGWMQIPVGGGIVADSKPEDEYRETLDKAVGMLRAVGS